jgi:hypothetical protein
VYKHAQAIPYLRNLQPLWFGCRARSFQPFCCADDTIEASNYILPKHRDPCRSVARRCIKLPVGISNKNYNRHHAAIRTTTYHLSPTVSPYYAHSRSCVRTAALSALQEKALLLQHEKTFTYGKEFSMTVKVTEAANGDQTVYIETDYPSANLILHWGVQGGRSYTGGWRLPDHRPKDTIQYKDRALQTSFKYDSLPPP